MENSFLNRLYSLVNGLMHPNSNLELTRVIHSPTSKRICPVTGLDISMQPVNSKFISPSGVEWYYLHKRKVFDTQLMSYLTDHWKNQPMIRQFQEIAHNIRNKDSNKRNSARRSIHRILEDKDYLFDQEQFIDKNKLKEAGF
jgi:hypothetical protein